MTQGHFEAKKHAYRQTQDGIVISFVVHPNDVAADLAVAPLGTRYQVAFAEIGEDEQPKDAGSSNGRTPDFESGNAGSTPAPATTPKERRPFHTLSRVQQAGILCDNRDFIFWLRSQFRALDRQGMSSPAIVRKICGVESRSELDSRPEAARSWDALRTEYEQATGRIAEARS